MPVARVKFPEIVRASPSKIVPAYVVPPEPDVRFAIVPAKTESTVEVRAPELLLKTTLLVEFGTPALLVPPEVNDQLDAYDHLPFPPVTQ